MSKPKHGLIDRLGRPIGQVLDWLGVPQKTITRIFLLLFRFTRPMTLGVRVAAFDRKGRVFLVRHTYTDGWYLPGGGVEVGDTGADTVRKELREEGNLDIQDEPKLISVHLNKRLSRRDHVLFYSCWATQTGPKIPDHEIAESGFFDPEQLPKGTKDSVFQRLAELNGKQPVSEFWS